MIREANVNDCSRIAEIHVFGWRCAYKDFVTIDYLFKKVTVKSCEEWFIKHLSDDYTYVYEENNVIKGFMTIGDCGDDDKTINTFELQLLYIEPLFQRQNIGTKFVNYCIKEAKNRSKNELVLWTFEKNKEAIYFYEKMGFKIDGKIKLKENYKEMRLNEIRLNMEL